MARAEPQEQTGRSGSSSAGFRQPRAAPRGEGAVARAGAVRPQAATPACPPRRRPPRLLRPPLEAPANPPLSADTRDGPSSFPVSSVRLFWSQILLAIARTGRPTCSRLAPGKRPRACPRAGPSRLREAHRGGLVLGSGAGVCRRSRQPRLLGTCEQVPSVRQASVRRLLFARGCEAYEAL